MEGMPAVVCQREETKDTPTPDEQSISLQHLHPESKKVSQRQRKTMQKGHHTYILMARSTTDHQELLTHSRFRGSPVNFGLGVLGVDASMRSDMVNESELSEGEGGVRSTSWRRNGHFR